MTDFTIEIKEVLKRSVDVKANTQIDAIEKVEEMYRNNEIVLDADDFDDVEFSESLGCQIARSIR